MKIYDNIIQGTEEWFQVRLGKFGSSDAQAVAFCGRGLDTICFQKVAEIIIGKPQESYTNEHIERGIKTESMARSAYEIETGNLVTQVGYIEISDYVGGSPDGMVKGDGLIEIKCPSDANYIRTIYEGKIDSKYIWQMQHLMLITNRKWCDFVVFNENLDKIRIQRVERDEEAIEKIKVGLESGERKIKTILEKVKKG